MTRFLTMGVMILGLVVFGCGPSEESKSSPSPTGSAAEKVAEAVKVVAGEAKDMAEPVVDKAADIGKNSEPVVRKTGEETKKTTGSVTGQTKATISQVVVNSKKITTETKESTTLAADKDVEGKTSAAVATTIATGKAVVAEQQAVITKTIVLKASYGNVTFPHELHAGSYDCTTCHGEDAPGLFGLDKKKAHGLCKGCHKRKSAGPTNCKECHKK